MLLGASFHLASLHWAGAGCLPHTTEAPFDCNAAFKNWHMALGSLEMAGVWTLYQLEAEKDRISQSNSKKREKSSSKASNLILVCIKNLTGSNF